MSSQAIICRRGGGNKKPKVVQATSFAELPIVANGSIGIVTSYEIASVDIGNEPVINPVPGSVIIETSIRTNPAAYVPITPKFAIYPFKAYQYLSSVWVPKELFIRYDNQWIPPSVYLYYLNNRYPVLTGEFQFRKWQSISGTVATSTTTLSFNDEYMVLAVSGNDYASAVCQPMIDIDLTQYKTLTVVVEHTKINTFTSGAIRVSVVSRTATYWDNNGVVKGSFPDSLNTDHTLSLDISNITGSYDVVIGVYNSRSAGCTTRIKEIRLVA